MSLLVKSGRILRLNNREKVMSKPIEQRIGNIALVVENYDDAIAFYTKKLQFELVEDTDLGGGKRWVQISPPNSTGTNLLLAQASNDEQLKSVGNQAGGVCSYFFKRMIFGETMSL